MLVNYLCLLCLFCMYFLFSSRTKKCPVSCVLCPFDESQNRNYARAKSVTALYIYSFVFFRHEIRSGVPTGASVR